MDSTILRIKNLKKEYFLDKFNRNLVIPGLNLKIEKGEFTVIMGNSGSGKSTLLYLIGGLEEPTDGEVWLNNKILPIDPKKNALLRRTSFGVVFQQNNLIPSLNLLENILISAFLVQKNRKEAKLRALELMAELGIESLQGRYPSQVSGGEQQRCSIARALVNSPDILLADEPTGSLNSSSTINVLKIFSELHSKGQTIIMVTHEIEAASYGEKVIYLRDGEVVGNYGLKQSESKDTREKALFNWLTEKGW